ncbi:MAG TPA: sigma factor-like helix-turn-helix DNA-binding protein [Chthoniobacterales bacterium]|jgi:hypothetical protein|nr:sigma factor-like helix-turn-helix DNA-binding protein [Chthoniobacterales bacterium]
MENDFFIIPAERRRRWSPRDFLQAFPAVVEQAVLRRYGLKGISILRGRLFRKERKVTLREIGEQFGVSREWIRFSERQILRMFALIFFSDHYVTAKFRLTPEFVLPLRQLKASLDANKQEKFTVRDWKRYLKRTWRVTNRDLNVAETLVLQILDYRPRLSETRHLRTTLKENGKRLKRRC